MAPSNTFGCYQKLRRGATKDEVDRALQIPHPRLSVKIDNLVMLVPIIPMGRPIPPQEEIVVHPQSNQTQRYEVSFPMTMVTQNMQPCNVFDSTREVTRVSQDANPIRHIAPMNPIIKARFEHLKDGYGHHENKLNEHDTRLKEHEERLAKHDGIIAKSNEILQSLKITHCEHLGCTKTTHGIIAASYFRCH